MTPVPITVDYYKVLEVVQTATPKEIVQSYRRLALERHPDRNARCDTTADFQQLGIAYGTLKDEDKRRAYDNTYPYITRNGPSPQTTQTPRPPPASTPQSGALSETAQLTALQKAMQERSAQWWAQKNIFDFSIFELQREIRRLEQEIKFLDSIVAADAAKEAQKESWGTWLLSPIYKRVEDSEEEKARKDRERQEKRIKKYMKERRLALKKADLKKEESLFRKAKGDVDAANLVATGKIRVIQDGILAREAWKRREMERVERERVAKIWKQQQEQQEKREREEAEAWRKQQAEKRAAESTRQACTSTCRHDGWWPKVQGRAACPKCYESWTYLLQCPGCKMQACPRCQGAMRGARTSRRAAPRVRIPSPSSFYDDY